MNNQLIFLPVDAEKNDGNCSLRLLHITTGLEVPHRARAILQIQELP